MIQKSALAGLLFLCSLGTSQAESTDYKIGDAMPGPVKAHFAIGFYISCSDTHTARVDRYEHEDKTTLLTYLNDSKDPYGYMLVHQNTLLLDNDPQDGHIDSISVLSLDDDVKICEVLPK